MVPQAVSRSLLNELIWDEIIDLRRYRKPRAKVIFVLFWCSGSSQGLLIIPGCFSEYPWIGPKRTPRVLFCVASFANERLKLGRL